jgi:hypothetical protein
VPVQSSLVATFILPGAEKVLLAKVNSFATGDATKISVKKKSRIFPGLFFMII